MDGRERPVGGVTDPALLPYYAGRSLLRMFIALFFSLSFTLVYGYAAARSRRAEKVLVPILDILQSVPVLGFLTITVTLFIGLFPGIELGLECASIFAIFTVAGLEHDVLLLPLAEEHAARARRGSRCCG